MSNKPSILKNGSGSKRHQPSRRKSRPQPPAVVGKAVREKKRPLWDSTVSDLNVHRLTNEEVKRRHQIHQSQNIDAARSDLYEQPRDMSTSLNSSGNMRPPSIPFSRRKIAPARKVVSASSTENLQDVLEQSDKTLADVRDLFGDEPKRYTGNPLVTVAPHVITNKTCLERAQQESMVDSGVEPTAEGSPGGIKHSSVLELRIRKPALNELPSPPPKFDLDDTDHTHSSYQPLINLSQFHQYLTHLDHPPTITHRTLTSPPPHANGRSSLSSRNSSSASDPLDDTLTSNGHSAEGVSRPHPLRTSNMPRSQVKNNYIQNGEENEISWMSSVVTELEGQVGEYERGLPADSISNTPSHKTGNGGSLTGMTSSLLQSITKLTYYLNQARKELAEERTLREELLQAMGEQQNLMDNLTQDVVRLCEENSSIKQELSQVQSTTAQQLQQLQSQVGLLSQQFNSVKVTPPATTATAVKGSIVSPIVSTTHSRLPTTPPQLVHSLPHSYKPVPSSSHPYSSSPITTSSLLASSHGPYAPLPMVDETSRTQAATNFTIPTSHLHLLQSSSSSLHPPVSSGSVLSSFPSIPPAPPPLSEALQTPLLSTYTSPSPPSHHLPLSSHTLKWTPPSLETSSPLALTSQWAPTQPSFSTARPHVNSTLNSHTPQPSSSLPAFTSIAQSILAELAAPLQQTVTSPTTTINDSALSTATS